MTFVHGKNTQVAIDALDLSAYFNKMDFSVDVDALDTTTFTANDHSFLAGDRAAKATVSGFYDPTIDPTWVAYLAAVTAPVITVGPAGLAVGSRARLVQANTSEFQTTSGIGSLVLASIQAQSTNAIGLGYSLVSSATALSGTTTNGTTVDTVLAVNSATWVVHFHLHAISATNVVLTVQDSADNVTFAAITGVASGTLTTPGVMRITGTGNVRRYIRFSATITGGAQTATATVAFARR
jgi:hypothetical protein